ncbi:hypothetical protein [Mesorhizobium helmanticense]|uniref:Uncharacterized protein n=1 Tax=Mesorhizobium helmanticense TaxID=1776423 RepID=A0A2T4J3K0_9HYPH|nr:hypothetical protein [Mesorhizobium helmanticense]PTE12486.1 hypothetical protein C9427_00555 [Mesorhizobium helmanticense]
MGEPPRRRLACATDGEGFISNLSLRERDAATIAQIGKLKANVLEFMPVTEGVAIVDQAMADVSAGKVSDANVASFMMW